MRMFEKHSTPTAYLWGIMTTVLGFFTLEQWVAVMGIGCTIGTFLINVYYRKKEYKLKERQYENTEKNIDGDRR
ncbi:phage holin family protein [Candidatus Arsenophonus nilaparvatae]|uniref:phage holin family protein n=2 Tax=Candidatus Arsenophonus nilaparvatae TaxID=1247023 RepID=UPI000509E26F|nr:phage holin family protein [Candidatus Arsenophonus nilaparvatae]